MRRRYGKLVIETIPCATRTPPRTPQVRLTPTFGRFLEARDTPKPFDITRFYITLSDYEVIHPPIASGQFGVVNKCRCKATGEILALKTLIRCDADNPAEAQKYEREIEMLATADHPALLSLRG